MGFSMLVNQRMLGPTFPRCTNIKERGPSVAYMEELVQRLKLVCKVTGCTNYHSALVRTICHILDDPSATSVAD